MGNGKSKPQLFLPVGLGCVKLLPKNRGYTEGEAILSMALDNFHNNDVTITGYSKLWGWSVGKVYRFFDKVGAEIVYPEDTKDLQKQRGKLVMKRNENGMKTDMMFFIDIKELQRAAECKRNENRSLLTKRVKSKDKNSAKADPKVTIFRNWFCNLYKEKFAREYVLSKSHYGKVGAQIKNLLGLDGLTFEELQYMAIEFIKDEDAYLEDAGYNFGNLLARAQQNKYQGYLNVQFKESFERFIVNEDGTHKYNAT